MAEHQLKKTKHKINMYVCGPTVYNHLHIGNIRSTLTFDMIKNALITTGHEVKYIQNITDINEKIEMQAKLENLSIVQTSDKYTKEFLNLLDAFNIKYNTNDIIPNQMTIVSIKQKMPQIIDFIEKLINKGYTYKTDDGIYIKTELIKDYGRRVANQNVNDNSHGIRISNAQKKNENDFVLWKFTAINSYYASFGNGVPGWHTECAAIIDHIFNSETIDIHGGGIDLKFPHHENESAQYFAVNKKDLAHNWLHNGHLSIDNQKMSKSIGNIVLAKDLLDEYTPAQIRLWLASVDFTKPLNLSNDTLDAFKKTEQKILQVLSQNRNNLEPKLSNKLLENIQSLDFPKLVNYLNQSANELSKNIGEVLGILRVLGIEFIPYKYSQSMNNLIYQRLIAKTDKDFKLADEIKNTIMKEESGVQLIDTQINGVADSYILGKLK
jgi:cysteinyl-tRNA synthetase